MWRTIAACDYGDTRHSVAPDDARFDLPIVRAGCHNGAKVASMKKTCLIRLFEGQGPSHTIVFPLFVLALPMWRVLMQRAPNRAEYA